MGLIPCPEGLNIYPSVHVQGYFAGAGGDDAINAGEQRAIAAQGRAAPCGLMKPAKE